jgi:hypothetical protein
MITTTNNKDEKIFAEKFKPFPIDKTDEKDEGNKEMKEGVDHEPDAQGGKDVSKSNEASAEKQTKHLDVNEVSGKFSLLEQLNKNVIGQGDAPQQKTFDKDKDSRFNNGESDGKYSRTDSTVLRSDITSRTLDREEVISTGSSIAIPAMTDSISVVAGDQLKAQQSFSSKDISGYKSENIVVGGTTKSDKKAKAKAKGTPAKVNSGIEQNQSIAYTPSSPAAEKKSENKKAQSNNLPAPNMNPNGVNNNDNNNNINIKGARGSSHNYVIDNRTLMDTAMKKYDEKDYGGAINSFDKVLLSDAGNYDALFYSGVSYLSVDKPDKAIFDLDKVLNKKDGKYYQDAQWYKALALIKQKENKKAKALLNEIVSTGGKYKTQAEDTLKQLE